jgi:hypothetical protein
VPRKVHDLTGSRFGALLVLRREPKPSSVKSGDAFWLCRCDCGNSRTVAGSDLKRGVRIYGTFSCGCLGRLERGNRLFKHGHRKNITPEYRAWANMHSRCANTRHRGYHNYGGRGIKVCESWRDFSSFIKDMGARPSDRHSIDRIDNDGDYEPLNCRWATFDVQVSNRRKTLVIEHDGQSMPLVEWARKTGISYVTLKQRLTVLKWSVERAVTTPVQRGPRKGSGGYGHGSL